MIPLIIFLGEVLPRTFALSHREQCSLFVTEPLTAFIRALLPVRWAIKKLFNTIVSPSGNQNGPADLPPSRGIPLVTRETYMHIFNKHTQHNDFTTEEATMIDRLSDFSQTLVKDAMIPLIEITGVEDTATLDETTEIVSNMGHSRLPVYHERIDNVVGIVNSFDLPGTPQGAQPITDFIRTVPFVPESKPIDELLIELQKQRTHMAIAVDEYGGTVGIITIEDILEEIVGEIQDEYDTAERVYRKIGWNRYRVSARMETDQLREQLALDLPDGDYETLEGFLLKQFEHIPRPGETTTYRNYSFVIESSDERSIGEVRWSRKKSRIRRHSKKLQMQGAQIFRNEAYLTVRRND